jgi:hypothetical protein
MVRPKYFTQISTHGTHDPVLNENGTSLHFHTDIAHMKEWPSLFSLRNASLHKDRKDFNAADKDEVPDLHNGFNGHVLNKDGSLTMHYDNGLHSWLDFLAHRGDTESSPAETNDRQ